MDNNNNIYTNMNNYTNCNTEEIEDLDKVIDNIDNNDVDIDIDISNYNRCELLEIIGKDENSSSDDIAARVDEIIQQYANKGNIELENFFIEARAKLLTDEADPGMPDNTEIPNQTELWYQNQYLLPQNQTQQDKITDRSNSIQISENNAAPVMKQKMLGINNTKPLSVVQDSLNPVLRQTIWRYITIDSLFRPNPFPYNYSPNAASGNETNFTVNLSESLKNVLSIKLKAIHIPATFYTFDPYIGNTCFWIQYIDSLTEPSESDWKAEDVSCCQVCITPGNYEIVQDLVDEINIDMSFCCNGRGCCAGTGDLSGLHVFIQNPLVVDKTIQFVNYSPYWVRLVFYDLNFNSGNCASCGNIHEPETGCEKAPTYQQNLGYYLGYRILNSNEFTLTSVIPPISLLTPPGGFSGSTLETYREDYFTYLATNNDISLNIIGVKTIDALGFLGLNSGTDNFPSFPTGYWNNTTAGPTLYGAATTPPNITRGEYILFALDDYTNNYPTNGLINIEPPNTKLSIPSYISKISDPSGSNICDTIANSVVPPPIPPITQYIPTFPRKLTQNQLYALNQIINNRQASTNMAKAPNPPDLFATIFTKTVDEKKAIVYEDTNSIYSRTYFGPITLERLRVRLLDSLGNLVNLHGHNWSFTLAVEQLYQY